MDKNFLFDILKIIVSFLGGGFLVAIYNSYFTNKANKIKKEVDLLQEQLNKLYGPLWFWIGQNKLCFAHIKNLRKAIDNYEEYGREHYDPKDFTAMFVRKKMEALQNDYRKKIKLNNNIIIKILQENFSYLDIDDMELIHKFILDNLRLSMEYADYVDTYNEFLSALRNHMEEPFNYVFLMEQELIDRIEFKFEMKKKILNNL